jgi:hypothetical protein
VGLALAVAAGAVAASRARISVGGGFVGPAATGGGTAGLHQHVRRRAGDLLGAQPAGVAGAQHLGRVAAVGGHREDQREEGVQGGAFLPAADQNPTRQPSAGGCAGGAAYASAGASAASDGRLAITPGADWSRPFRAPAPGPSTRR